jgi:toxin YoeB
MYEIRFLGQVKEEIAKLKRNEPSTFKKIERLLFEIMLHPYTGTGKPKPLSGDRVGQWSRRITDKHRLVYSVNDTEVVVLVLSASGHYDDK